MRESPAGSGESDAGDWREVIPGGDEEDKAAETNGNALETTLRDTCEEGENEKQKCVGEQLHSPYEEELDPRIQVRDSRVLNGRQLDMLSSQVVITVKASSVGNTGLLLVDR